MFCRENNLKFPCLLSCEAKQRSKQTVDWSPQTYDWLLKSDTLPLTWCFHNVKSASQDSTELDIAGHHMTMMIFHDRPFLMTESCTTEPTQLTYHYHDMICTSWHLKSEEFGLFVEKLIQNNNKENIKCLYYWPFVKRIHWWLVDSPYNQLVMWKHFHAGLILF